jgi:transcriptional regulator with XRE-family HTH domain
MAVLTPGQRIRSAREALDLTRPELATAARVSVSTIARLELNDRLPSALATARIARAVEVPLEQLLDEPAQADPAA